MPFTVSSLMHCVQTTTPARSRLCGMGQAELITLPSPQERAQPPFEAEKRPDQKSAIDLAAQMLLEELGNGFAIHERVDSRVSVDKLPAHVVQALPSKPASIRTRESLLFAVCDFRGDV